jgi:hypothetical protein
VNRYLSWYLMMTWISNHLDIVIENVCGNRSSNRIVPSKWQTASACFGLLRPLAESHRFEAQKHLSVSTLVIGYQIRVQKLQHNQ